MGHQKTRKFLPAILACMMALSNSSFISNVIAEENNDPASEPTAEVVTENLPEENSGDIYVTEPVSGDEAESFDDVFDEQNDETSFTDTEATSATDDGSLSGISSEEETEKKSENIPEDVALSTTEEVDGEDVVDDDTSLEKSDEDDSDVEDTSLHIYRAETMAEFTAAVAQLSDDPDVRLLVSIGQDLSDVLNDGKAVYYDRTYVIEFRSEEDRDLAYDIVKDVLNEGGTVAKDSRMDLCEEDVVGENANEEVDEVSSEDNFDYEIEVDPEAVSNAEDALTIAEVSDDGVKVIALIDTGVNGDLADAKVNLTTDGDDDLVGHGTDMADMINHIAGDKASILSIKAFNDNGTGNISTVNAAIEYAIEANVDIINISAAIRDSERTDVLKETVMKAIQKGIIVVAAAGNNSSDVADYVPANIEGVDTIGAAYADGEVYSCFTATPFSNYGSQIDHWYIADSTSLAAAQESAVLAAGIENEGWAETNRWYRFPYVKFHNGGSNDVNYNPLNGGNYSPFTWISEEEFGLAYEITGSGNLVTERDPSSWDGFAYRGSSFTIDGESVSCIDPDVYSSNNANYTKSESCSTSSSTARYWYDDSKYRGSVHHFTVDLQPVPTDPNRYDPTKDTFVYENYGSANLSSDGYYVIVSVENGDKNAINARISGNRLLVDIDENAADMPDGIKVSVRTDKREIGYTDWITYYQSCSSIW